MTHTPVTLQDWLAHTERLHAQSIDLGLKRVQQVRTAMGLHPAFPILTVAGTNGKGSTCAFLSTILAQAGYRVGLYTSPHLLRYNERICVDGHELEDDRLCEAFAQVERYRDPVPLTPFEFGTLAALWIFQRSRVDVAVLEVGLGGRLDAVNAFDPDCAIVTSIALDHEAWLGSTREAIGFEKAGIFRSGRPAICADPDPPASIAATACAAGARLYQLGTDFWVESGHESWRFGCRTPERIEYQSLASIRLQGSFQYRNAAAALAALHAVQQRLPVSGQAVQRGLAATTIRARFQRLEGAPEVILDVAHNPQAAQALAQNLRENPCAGKTWAVLAMLADKDIRGVVLALAHSFDGWYLSGLSGARGASLSLLRQQFAGIPAPGFECVDCVAAFSQARAKAAPQDRIVVFGSFLTVAAVMSDLQSRAG